MPVLNSRTALKASTHPSYSPTETSPPRMPTQPLEDMSASTSALPAAGPSPSTLWQRKGKTPTTGARADPWWKVTYNLENKGSVARDHLANEVRIQAV